VVIMPDTALADALRIAERIRNHVAGSPFKVAQGQEMLTVTISIGVSATAGESDSPEALLKRADEGVYQAKASGRNAVVGKAA
jgi:two-component system, cell cycle response regulator